MRGYILTLCYRPSTYLHHHHSTNAEVVLLENRRTLEPIEWGSSRVAPRKDTCLDDSLLYRDQRKHIQAQGRVKEFSQATRYVGTRKRF